MHTSGTIIVHDSAIAHDTIIVLPTIRLVSAGTSSSSSSSSSSVE